jgi:cysteine desulfurase
MAEIYLDANASAPLRPEARAALLAALDLGPGNASSAHAAGRRLRKALGDARAAVAALAGARESEVVFTSGATESNALAIHGTLAAAEGAIVFTRAEHSSVLRVAERLAAAGRDVRWAGVDRWGRFDADEVVRLADGAALVAATLAQSVTGAIEPVAVLAGRLGSAALHADAAQAAGRIDVRFAALGASTLSLSAHKIGGPHGIGALVVRDGAAWRNPHGDAAQERGRRAGTEAVALAAAFGAAASAVMAHGAAERAAMAAAAAELRRGIASIPGAEILTPEDAALPNTLLVAFDGCPGDALMAALDGRGVRVSTGSACASGARVPPEVLVAAGRPRADAARAVRLSASWATAPEEILAALPALADSVARVRAAGPTS